jgi:hypothetical protein
MWNAFGIIPKETAEGKERSEAEGQLFRKGDVGDWKN